MLFYYYTCSPFKGSVWLCKVVELSMQYCQKLLAASFETYKTFERSANPDLERKFDVQNSWIADGHLTEWVFLKLLINNDIKCKKVK